MSNATFVKIGTITQDQWGLITTAQIRTAGIGPSQLTGMINAGVLRRIDRGVYQLHGAPDPDFMAEKAAWLSLGGRTAGLTAAGATAAELHEVGTLIPDSREFVTSEPRRTRRHDVRLRCARLPREAITVRHGLPVMTLEHTIADLVGQRHDLSIVGEILYDADDRGILEWDLLRGLLAPLEARLGYTPAGGDALIRALTLCSTAELPMLAEQCAVGRQSSVAKGSKFSRR